MLPRRPFVMLLWFLCAVIAFPTASGLLCYSCQDYPGSNQPCGNPSVRKCEVNHDSCMSATVQYNGMRSTTTIKNCTTTLLCLLNICDKLDHNLTTMDMKTAACAVSCCHGDLCNGEEVEQVSANTADRLTSTEDPIGNSGTLRPSTNPPTTYQPPVTTQRPSPGCGEVSNDTLISPGYPNYYPNNMDCSYSVPIPHGMAMKITLNYFYLESVFSCRYDFLSITNEKNKTFGTFCGHRPGNTVIVTGQYVNISFHSDGSVSERGYNISFSAVQLGCGEVSNDTLLSPGYPNHYLNNMDCSYSVPIPNGMAMYITFHYFNLENQYACRYDFLSIKNEKNQTFGTFCGHRPGNTVIVTGHYVNISFHSDGSVSERGYNISFSAVPLGTLRPSTNSPTTYQRRVTTRSQRPSPGCGGVSNDILTSPGYPNYYPNNMDCSYSVPIPHGMTMKITFNYFYLESVFLCRYDFLSIRNDNNQNFGKYCGYYSPGLTVNVTGHYVNISFHSDASVNDRGYNISLTAVPLATLSPTPAYSTNAPSSTAALTVKPTGCPSARPGSDTQSRLKYFIALLRLLLDQMEQIVDNDLRSNFSISKREHMEIVKKTIDNVEAAMKSADRPKRDVSQAMMVDQLKKKAAEFMTKLTENDQV